MVGGNGTLGLENGLEECLKRVLTCPLDGGEMGEKWKSDIVPQIKQRLDQIVEKLGGKGDGNEEIGGLSSPDGLWQIILSQKEKIERVLDNKFHGRVPFTVQRIGELVLYPEVGGYSLESRETVLKYFNAVLKTINVASSLDEFPVETQSVEEEHKNGDSDTVTNDSIESTLVQIPWLVEGTMTNGIKNSGGDIGESEEDKVVDTSDNSISDTIEMMDSDSALGGTGGKNTSRYGDRGGQNDREGLALTIWNGKSNGKLETVTNENEPLGEYKNGLLKRKSPVNQELKTHRKNQKTSQTNNDLISGLSLDANPQGVLVNND